MSTGKTFRQTFFHAKYLLPSAFCATGDRERNTSSSAEISASAKWVPHWIFFSIIVSPACARDGKKNQVHYNHKTEWHQQILCPATTTPVANVLLVIPVRNAPQMSPHHYQIITHISWLNTGSAVNSMHPPTLRHWSLSIQVGNKDDAFIGRLKWRWWWR